MKATKYRLLPYIIVAKTVQFWKIYIQERKQRVATTYLSFQNI